MGDVRIIRDRAHRGADEESMSDRSLARQFKSFPPVFWVANLVEVLERFAYYGIYVGFGIYMASLGMTRADLGWVQSIFLFLSYVTPVFSGTLADRYGFKRVLIVSYLAYLPSILLLTLTKSFSGIALTMLFIGFAAGIFKPLIAGTVRVTTDASNKTLGFGIFYAMVNVGASFGPIVAGQLRLLSWNYVFIASAIGIGLMLVITLLFYKEPPREPGFETLGEKLRGIAMTLSNVKFAVFLALLGLFFWLPFWAFFNLCAVFVEDNVDTAALYQALAGVLGGWQPGRWLLGVISHADEQGVHRVLGESISHTGYMVMVLQLFISKAFEKAKPIPSFMFGLAVAAAGLFVMGMAVTQAASLVFLGILLFAVGEMITSPRIQEYITWIAPKEQAGLYMGSNFLAVAIGAVLSGRYTAFYGWTEGQGHPEWAWYVMGGHVLLSVVVFWLFVKLAGEFEERTT
jgi:dipeptide/tripeptide permease